MAEPIISVSGLRGIVGESLDPMLAIRYVTAYASVLDENQVEGPLVVSRDGRTTGKMLASAIVSGLAAVGRDVLLADVAATPTTGVLVRQHQAAGGVQISASHNPPPYNGIKLFGNDGRVITASAGQPVMERYVAFRDQSANQSPAWQAHDSIGCLSELTDTTEWHLEKVLATVDVPLIQSRKFKVVLDSNHGAGSLLGRRLLEALGTEFEILGDAADGNFEHPPEPTRDNLASVAEQAVNFGADVVFCQDPDADRLAIIDEHGKYIGEEYTVSICLANRLNQEQGPVVINCATSRMNEDLAHEHQCQLYRSAVGEANVTSLMQETNAVYGGEGSGGPIDPKVGFVRDSFVGMAQVLEAAARQDTTISGLVSKIPAYSIHKATANVDRTRLSSLFQEIQESQQDAQADQQDGLRLTWPDRWLLVRASNTEPIIRIIAESKSEEQSREMCAAIAKMI